MKLTHMAFGFIILGLTSCDRLSLFDSAPVAACEKYVKSRVLSKATYARLGMKKWTEPISEAELDKLREPPSIKSVGKPELYLVGIQYEDLNPSGVPLELAGICAFEMRDGELPSTSSIRSSGAMAERRTALWDLSVSGALPKSAGGDVEDLPEYPCCLEQTIW